MHGPVFATATVGGKPYALSRRRSTFGRDGLNLVALKQMTEGKARTPGRFWKTANKFGFTFNWAWASRNRGTAYFSSGLSSRSARAGSIDACRRSAPASTSGGPTSARTSTRTTSRGPDGLLLNWNNRSAPGFMHGDDEPYGSVQRVENFDQWPAQPQITDNVGIMNRAATEDVRSSVWPIISRVLRSPGPAPDAARSGGSST